MRLIVQYEAYYRFTLAVDPLFCEASGVQCEGNLLIMLKAGSIPRPFVRFRDRKTRSLTVLSLILRKVLLVPSMYTFTGESKLQ